MNSNFLRTKIIATLGPASWDIETIEKMLLAGTNVFRLNFAHTSYEKLTKLLRLSEKYHLKIINHAHCLQICKDLS